MALHRIPGGGRWLPRLAGCLRPGPGRDRPPRRLSPGADEKRAPVWRRARASSLMSPSRTVTPWSSAARARAHRPSVSALRAAATEPTEATPLRSTRCRTSPWLSGSATSRRRRGRGASTSDGSHPRRGTVAETDRHGLVRPERRDVHRTRLPAGRRSTHLDNLNLAVVAIGRLPLVSPQIGERTFFHCLAMHWVPVCAGMTMVESNFH